LDCFKRRRIESTKLGGDTHLFRVLPVIKVERERLVRLCDTAIARAAPVEANVLKFTV
jgi:hypothetical protein